MTAATETMPDQGELIAEVAVKGGDTIRVHRVQWGKYLCVDVRRWVPKRAGDPGGFIPTTKGLRLQAATWAQLLRHIERAVGAVLEELDGEARGETDG